VVAYSAFGNRLFLVIAGGLAMVQPVMAAPFTSAKVLRMVEGTEVFIDSNKARVNQTAVEGSVLSTRRSRAELLFNTRAIGLLGRSSAIRIGVRCFQLDSGVVVVNGTQRACLGSRILGVRGTTYVLAKENDAYSVSVLVGEGIVAADLPEENAALNILNRYPRSNPSLNIQLGGYGAVYPSGGGAFTGGLSYFQPLFSIPQPQSAAVFRIFGAFRLRLVTAGSRQPSNPLIAPMSATPVMGHQAATAI